jgi:DNA-directed RNA polymerase specialized sigma24 family protein
VPGRSVEPTDRDFSSLVDRWADQLHDVSQNIVGSSAVATAICHEVLASLSDLGDGVPEDDPARVALLLATREQSLQYLETHGWHAPPADGAAAEAGTTGPAPDPGATRQRVLLAHAAATVIGAEDISVLDLHDRHGVDAETVADALGVTADAAPYRLAQLRTELDDVIAAYTLWNEGRPRCDELATELDALERASTVDDADAPIFDADRIDQAGDSDDFDEAAFRVIELHRRTCATCTGRHQALVDPAARFLTAPTAPLSPAIRSYLLAEVTHPPARWTQPSTTVPDKATTKLDDDEINALWESATTTRPPRSAAATRVTPRSAPKARATPPSAPKARVTSRSAPKARRSTRRKARRSTRRKAQRHTLRRRRIVVGAAVLAAVALTLLLPNGGSRIVTETPPPAILPDSVGDEVPVWTLAPLPAAEPALTPGDPASTATTNTTAPDTTPSAATTAP